MRTRGRRSRLLLCAMAMATLAAAPTATAQTARASARRVTRLYACATRAGQLTLTSAVRRCPKGQRKLRWNVRGPRGARGAQGATGPQGPANGPAGGDLAGTYPNPSIAPGAVTSGKLGLPLALTGTLAGPFLSVTGANTAGGVAGAANALLAVTENDATSTGPAIYGETQSQFANLGTVGLMGVASGTGGAGLLAYSANNAGHGPALVAIANGDGNAITADSERGNGIEATVSSANRSALYGWSPVFATGGTGVRAMAYGTNAVALRATASADATTAAVLTGDVTISGDLDISGNLSKGSGTFRIDNPLAPAKAYLSHSFVESPDMKNIYDGIVTTDGDGFATVTMPAWFDALNGRFRYQLTVLGRSFARAVVWDELDGRTFRIRTDEPRVKVSWQVTGIREDAYARAHPTPVVERKTGDERGRYLHPELYGRPASKAVGARR